MFSNTKALGVDAEHITRLVIDRLKDMPGLSIILNTYSKRRYGKDFVKLVAEDPKSAYEILLEVLKNNTSTEIVFTYILKPIVSDAEIDSILLEIKKSGKLEARNIVATTP